MGITTGSYSSNGGNGGVGSNYGFGSAGSGGGAPGYYDLEYQKEINKRELYKRIGVFDLYKHLKKLRQ